MSRRIPTFRIFCLQITNFFEVDPRGVESLTSTVQSQIHLSWLFTVVQKYLQNQALASGSIRVCSPLFAWVGVLLV